MQIAVIGAGVEHEAEAEAIGRLLAEQGSVVITGGLGEVMAAAARGAKAAGGTTIGLLPTDEPGDANEWIDYAIATGVGQARNLAVVASAAAVIVVGCSWGTISEIAFARRLHRPVVVLGNDCGLSDDGIVVAVTAAEAVLLATQLVARQQAVGDNP